MLGSTVWDWSPQSSQEPLTAALGTHCLVGDDELDDGEGVEHSDGSDVPGRE